MNAIIEQYLPEVIHFIEIIGIIVIVVGCLKAFVGYALSFLSKESSHVRIELRKTLALGLEYKMAAEILKTVLIRDLSEIWILGSIIILRAFLSLLIHFEIKAEASHMSAHLEAERGGKGKAGKEKAAPSPLTAAKDI